jgi:HAD superfamily phosphoserine phosphatase-like hydrolase
LGDTADDALRRKARKVSMTIGLFLDVDNTLTQGFIQQNYAEMVQVGDDYFDIETKYANDDISSDQFGEQLIKLFNRTEFNEEFAKNNFARIPLKESAEALLRCRRSGAVEIFLVSAGPSYYVSRLAEKYKIPSEYVLCSEYTFDKEGKLVGCNAVSPKQKHDFAVQYGRLCTLTIGVGDDELHDSSFLDACDIGLLIPKSGHIKVTSKYHIVASNLSLVMAIVTNLEPKLRAVTCTADAH